MKLSEQITADLIDAVNANGGTIDGVQAIAIVENRLAPLAVVGEHVINRTRGITPGAKNLVRRVQNRIAKILAGEI